MVTARGAVQVRVMLLFPTSPVAGLRVHVYNSPPSVAAYKATTATGFYAQFAVG
ncbi:hypothetical protein [Nonomuraea typhae]|uniref:Uncharacterized protein n=1 Tax=Nonomuraea typhae TaxID=2603600 RepID=A0ABW7Z4C0_9ACTN